VETCAALRDAGFLLVCVTNQPDVARGLLSQEALDAIHDRLRDLLPLDEILFCPHDDPDGCTCRKPLPGMLFDAAHRLEIDLGASVIVGDTWRDIGAGKTAGCATVFLDRGYSQRVPEQPDVTVRDLHEATAWILERARL
jgi:D-glycero-D-manno-heptose 1,7-bisphosphate phosphatase